jgi:hypothetical protein
MSTDRELIEQAQRDVKPRDVLLMSPMESTLTPLDCGSLRRLVEHQTRRMNWEEWMDVRDAWCRCFRVVYVACPRGDTTAIKRAAELGARDGKTYVLIDYL